MKQVIGIYGSTGRHWVGDGFPVRTLFSHNSLGARISPFLMLDYAGPTQFVPTQRQRGVGGHPHRGFETVTIVYQGEVEHRDSTGAGGIIGPGDVQWMTAGAGILHDEFHSAAFTRDGGTLEMVQLWVNLPAADKLAAPGYQGILNGDIPAVELADGAGCLRVIAGEYAGRKGPAHTFTPMDVWDMRLNQGKVTELTLEAGRTAMLVVLRGEVKVNGQVATAAQMVMLDSGGRRVSLEPGADAHVLLLSGEPIDEPVVAQGPFVMNTQNEIRQAIADFQSGGFGRI
ncbi:MAG TPA: quercetin 2,3-dioxygenase [Janthinobacterium sp.]|nr:quercetin 2,3-dioxygenase [Janthinobacterium sp.]